MAYAKVDLILTSLHDKHLSRRQAYVMTHFVHVRLNRSVFMQAFLYMYNNYIL